MDEQRIQKQIAIYMTDKKAEVYDWIDSLTRLQVSSSLIMEAACLGYETSGFFTPEAGQHIREEVFNGGHSDDRSCVDRSQYHETAESCWTIRA